MERVAIPWKGGCLMVYGNKEGLKKINFLPGKPAQELVDHDIKDQNLRNAKQQLTEYFQGTRKDFTLKLAPEGTPFQKEVWAALQSIPSGETRTYSSIAQQLDKPKAVRAVGAANARNPLPVVIPCHRVVGKNGHLTGFSAGLDTKQWLIEHEKNDGCD